MAGVGEPLPPCMSAVQMRKLALNHRTGFVFDVIDKGIYHAAQVSFSFDAVLRSQGLTRSLSE